MEEIVNGANQEVLFSSNIDPWSDDTDFTTFDAVKYSYRDYCILQICDTIGTHDFKTTYMALIEDILSYDIKSHILFCNEIVKKLTDVYGIVFPEVINVLSEPEIENILNLLTFIEYGCSDVLSTGWFHLLEQLNNLDIRKINLDTFFNKPENYNMFMNNIIEEIHENKKQVPYLFFVILDSTTQDHMFDILNRMSRNNWQSIFTNVRKRQVLKELST